MLLMQPIFTCAQQYQSILKHVDRLETGQHPIHSLANLCMRSATKIHLNWIKLVAVWQSVRIENGNKNRHTNAPNTDQFSIECIIY